MNGAGEMPHRPEPAALRKRFTGLTAPVGEFDATSASAEDLQTYGLPARPDAEDTEARAVWDALFGHPLMLKTFEFNAELVRAAPYRPQLRSADERIEEISRYETSANWSGAYITANNSKSFMEIWGIWRVPRTLSLPPGAPPLPPGGRPYACSNWIGLDGQRRYFNSSLPQMGTALTLDASGLITGQAWTQWWARGTPTLPVPVPNFSVNTGDLIGGVLTAVNPELVVCVFINLTTFNGQVVKITPPLAPRPDKTPAYPAISGSTAEWIVERPRVPGSTDLYNFPDYGETDFSLCYAVEAESIGLWFQGTLQDLQSTRLIRMYETLDNPMRTRYISMPRKTSDTAFTVHYGDRFP